MKWTLKWTESFEFARVKRREYGKLGVFGHLIIYLVLWVIFFLLGNLISIHSIVPTLIGAAIVSFVIAFPIVWLVSFVPNSIYMNESVIGSGRSFILFSNIDYAVVGTLESLGKTYNILSITTIDNVHHMYGLSNKIIPQKLADLLRQRGVNVQ